MFFKNQCTFRRLVRQFWHPVRLRTMSVFLARFEDCSIATQATNQGGLEAGQANWKSLIWKF